MTPIQKEHVVAGVHRQAALVFGLALLLVSAAIWGVQWFVTQDGLAHLYNAHILLELRKPGAHLAEVYRAAWSPLPNLAGHLSLMALLTVMPPRWADRTIIITTCVGLACAVAWLRVRVAGWRGAPGAALLAVLLALNWMWLMGFYSFLLGACLYCLTLGMWWVRRERFNWRAALLIAALLVIGYFCHIVSFGLTVVGLGVLAVATPGANWRRRIAWTAASCVPTLPLLLVYRALMKAGGGAARPVWRQLESVWSLRAWLLRWAAAATLQLSGRKYLPFSAAEAGWHAVLAPTVLAAVGLALLLAVAWAASRSPSRRPWRVEERGWWALALLLFAIWSVAPDDLGEQHGSFLRPRLLLLALIALVPLLRFDLPVRVARWGTGLIAAALLVQIAWVWDYALATNRTATEFSRAQSFVGSEQRIGTILLPDAPSATPSRFTVHPLLHLDAMLGIGNGNVVWNNYETAYYLFPVKCRDPQAAQRAQRLDDANRQLPMSGLSAAPQLQPWAALLARDHGEIDRLLVWGDAPELSATLRPWYEAEPVFASEHLRVFRARR